MYIEYIKCTDVATKGIGSWPLLPFHIGRKKKLVRSNKNWLAENRLPVIHSLTF